jgi:NAD-dependent deacetylase
LTQLQEVRIRLQRARALVVLTGAGVSADSGVPTFRGKDGLWRNFRAEDLATPEAFSRDPRTVWEWYDWRRGLLATKHPNPAHYALAELENRYERFALITQNVDGLHSTAGSKALVELHGNIWKVRCTSCGQVRLNREVPITLLPLCPECEGLLRPHIVWFGESLNPDDLAQSQEAVLNCDLLLIVGTSGVVYPAASFASVARAAGAFVVEVNLDPTPHSTQVDVALHGRAKDLLPQLL